MIKCQMTNDKFQMKVVLLFLFFVLSLFLISCSNKKEEVLKTVKVERGNIKAQISTTGIVMPRNRLEIKPPVAGRIESVLIQEGMSVRKSQILAYMSSSDRAALLDAARARGTEELKYWQDVYRPAPIIAPLNGFIIQRNVETGQTVTAQDVVLVMADKLIAKAQVDETDIGRIKNGQKVNIELDSYPGQGVSGRVELIAYESKTVNNVNIYEVDILLSRIPSFFRAGMSATVDFILEEKENVLLLSLDAIKKVGLKSYVFVKDEKDGKVNLLAIEIGLENTKNAEILGGLTEGREVIIPDIGMVQKLNEKYSNNHRRGPMNPFQKRN